MAQNTGKLTSTPSLEQSAVTSAEGAPRKNSWRSLDDLANTPEFRALAAEEFPGFNSIYEGLGEAEPNDENPAEAALNRRSFLALSAAALGLAGLAGCRRPDLEILPFSAIPDDQVGQLSPGQPTFYATCLPRPGGALPVLVESHDGRPTKVEGNPKHPASLGSTDVYAQAAVLDLYSPDRVMSEKYPGVMEKRSPQSWGEFDRFARTLADNLSKNGGDGFYVLADQVPSPSLRLTREHVKSALPKASWHTYEPVDTTEALKGSEVAFGSKLVAKYNFAAIDRILALDSDFLGCDPDQVANCRAFGRRRRLTRLVEGGRYGIMAGPISFPEPIVHLTVDETGIFHLPPEERTERFDTLDNYIQLQNYLKGRVETEKRRTGKSKPEITIVFTHNSRGQPTEKFDAIAKVCREVGVETVWFRSGFDVQNRLYSVESTYTVTGTMADHRLRLAAGQIGSYLLTIARHLRTHFAARLKKPLLAGLDGPDVAVPSKWIDAVAHDLADNVGKSAVIVGHRQPSWVHALAHAVNDSLGAFQEGEKESHGASSALVEFRPAPPEVLEKGIAELTADMAAGKVKTLLIVGGNPVFNAPADLGFRGELQKVGTKIRLGLFFDQTSEECDWHLPLCHSLESWGDAEASDGTLCCVQPLIAPLNGGKGFSTDVEPPPRGGRTALEVLALLTQFPNPEDGKAVSSYLAAQKAAYQLVRKVFSDRSGIAVDDKTFDVEFNRYKQIGFLTPEKDKGLRKPVEKPATDPAKVVDAIATAKKAVAPTKDALEVTFHPDYSVLDGRFAMNLWLQELPDPITKLVWDNAAVISPATAVAFNLKQGDVVKLMVNGSALEIPVFLLPGQSDFSIAVAYGQFGVMRINHVPNGGGFDVFPVRRSNALHTATGVTLEKTGKQADLVVTQEHGVIPEGREIIVDLSFEDLNKKHGTPDENHGRPHHDPAQEYPSGPVKQHGGPGSPKVGFLPEARLTEENYKKGFQGAYGNKQQPPAPAVQKQERFSLDLARPELLDSQFQWGMVIDLTACTGCSACTIACQAENNIPVVGKTEVKRNREMHWIRVDRYFTTYTGGTPEEPQIVTQPIACVHCEQAPCEQVCPVNAAVHSPEGLNLQVYNRCIGTRYCSNACPYKARRFNWFDFNKRHIDELRVPTPLADGGAALEHNLTPETLRMQKNPDVTVRMRGVMEKCTYCVQRIERGKYGAKIAATEVAQGRRTIPIDDKYRAEGGVVSSYRKPRNPPAAGYDLDAQGRVIVPDGLIVTACQAACPTQAITFGNALDPHSRVSAMKKQAGEYPLLGDLNTKPRTSFLPRVRNLNPEMLNS